MLKVLSIQQAYQSDSDDIIVIGSHPFNEIPPVSGNRTDYRQEICAAFIQQLRRKFGDEPTGCCYFILYTENSSGCDYEAAIQYNRDSDIAINYATIAEFGDLYWDDTAKSDLQSLFPQLKIV